MRPVHHSPLLLLILALVAFSGCSGDKEEGTDKPQNASNDSGLEILVDLPDFSLTDQKGNSFGSADLEGRVWIAGFIFTRCGSVCPQLTGRMEVVQGDLIHELSTFGTHLVSFSVDPEYDTPEVLSAYADKYGAMGDHWTFLTGTRDEIWQLSENGFKLGVGEAPDNAEMPIFHSEKLVLVDGEGRVRGFYDGTDRASVETLILDVRKLLHTEELHRLRRVDYPVPSADVVPAGWMKPRQSQQQSQAGQIGVFHDFTFTDAVMDSGITFSHGVVEDAGKFYKAVHYDHGTGLAAADVDGDGRTDLFFVNQLGVNELWRNAGGGKFEKMIDSPDLRMPYKTGVSASFADVDNDGDPDLYVTTVKQGNQLFLNNGKGRFSDATDGSGVDYVGHSSGSMFFDYDNDGLLDLFVTNVGEYTTGEIGPGNYYVGHGDAFGGHLKPERNESSRLFKNLGDGKFRDVTEAMGIVDVSWSGDCTPLDVNGDGWQDLYLLNMQGHDQYYENQGGKRFAKKSRDVFPKTSWGGMSVKSFDFDNDGDMDVMTTDMHSDMTTPATVKLTEEKLKPAGPDSGEAFRMHWPESFLNSNGQSVFGNAMHRNDGNGNFAEVSDEINAENYWPWGFSVGDLNADGWQDAFVATSMNYPFRYQVNTVFLNDGGRFADTEFILGVEPRRDGRMDRPWYPLACAGADKDHDLCGSLGLTEDVMIWGTLGSRSSVIFDLDGDGDQDVVTAEFNDGPMVLISDLAAKTSVSHLEIALEGSRSNRAGFGARVEVKSGDTTWTKVHDGKSGYMSQSQMPLYFGLGDAEQADEIVVSWPSGQKDIISGPVAAGRRIRIVEGKGLQ
ncbi:hypothetical protein ABI59_07635 [Acidobacteria bacterium Mor1]|nr:hypothetical protein ABI59_07635 [Acidobacteria bacterium Mor1]